MAFKKTIFPVLFGILVAGCSHAPQENYTLGFKDQSYILAERLGAQRWCYVRVLEGIPIDQVCVNGDTIKYSENTRTHKGVHFIPSTVYAVFDNADDDDPL
ncbi:MAG: hypothetical protein AAGA88_10535 [Pseudomonadota bacterium]